MNHKGRFLTGIIIGLLMSSSGYGQSTAGAIFLLISPGARAGGMAKPR